MEEKLTARGKELLARATELGFVIRDNPTPSEFLFEMVMQLAEILATLQKKEV